MTLKKRFVFPFAAAMVALVGLGAAGVLNAAPTPGTALPTGSSAAQLPVASIDPATTQVIDSAVSDAAALFGIDQTSLQNIRVLTSNSVGTWYVVPAAHGVCLVAINSSGTDPVACGDQGNTNGGIVSLLIPDAAGTNYVGAGVYLVGHHVSIVRGDGTSVAPSQIPGGFAVTGSAGLSVSQTATFVGQ